LSGEGRIRSDKSPWRAVSMCTHEGNSRRDQAASDGVRIDVARFKDLVNPHALEIIGRRMKIVGNRRAREVRIMNTHRGEKTPSASWNSAKGLFCDKGDARYDGDIIHFSNALRQRLVR
jgi:hypothetical protein